MNLMSFILTMFVVQVCSNTTKYNQFNDENEKRSTERNETDKLGDESNSVNFVTKSSLDLKRFVYILFKTTKSFSIEHLFMLYVHA